MRLGNDDDHNDNVVGQDMDGASEAQATESECDGKT
jgi:hypothetical protein